MALDFPASPINGQAYGSYVYNSTVGAWQSKEDPATVATVSTTAPASANPGDLWYDSDDGTSYMYYNDGTSAQWVELLSSGLPLLDTKANISGNNSFSGGVNYFGDGGTNGTFISSNSGRAQFSTNNIALTPLTVRGISGQTNALQEWQDSTSAVILKITSNGNLSVGAAATPLEKIHATGRIIGSSASYYSTNVIGTSIGESTDGSSNADVDMRRWTGTANGHGTGRIATDISSNMLFYTDAKTTNTYASTERMRISASGLTVSGPTVTTAISDAAYNRVLNPAGAVFTTNTNAYTGAIRIVLPVGWTSHMHKFNVSVYDYNNLKSFDVMIAGYNYSGGSWVNPSAYVIGNPSINLNYTVRFGYTAGGKACIYIGETTSTWNYPQIAINNILVGFSNSSNAWLSGWTVDFVTAFESVTQTVINTQAGLTGLVPIVPPSVAVGSGTGTIAADGVVTFTSASSISLNNVFSSAYTNYQIIVDITSRSASTFSVMRLRSAGVDTAGTNYDRTIAAYGNTNTPQANANAGGDSWSFAITNNARANYIIDLMSPFQSVPTTAHARWAELTSGTAIYSNWAHGFFRAATSFDGFSMIAATGNASGTIRVYGMR